MELDDEMAMSIGANFAPETVQLADWLDVSVDCDLAAAPFLALIRKTALEVRECAASVADLARAEGWHVPLIDEIVAVANRRSASLESQIDPPLNRSKSCRNAASQAVGSPRFGPHTTLVP